MASGFPVLRTLAHHAPTPEVLERFEDVPERRGSPPPERQVLARKKKSPDLLLVLRMSKQIPWYGSGYFTKIEKLPEHFEDCLVSPFSERRSEMLEGLVVLRSKAHTPADVLSV